MSKFIPSIIASLFIIIDTASFASDEKNELASQNNILNAPINWPLPQQVINLETDWLNNIEDLSKFLSQQFSQDDVKVLHLIHADSNIHGFISTTRPNQAAKQSLIFLLWQRKCLCIKNMGDFIADSLGVVDLNPTTYLFMGKNPKNYQWELYKPENHLDKIDSTFSPVHLFSSEDRFLIETSSDTVFIQKLKFSCNEFSFLSLKGKKLMGHYELPYFLDNTMVRKDNTVYWIHESNTSKDASFQISAFVHDKDESDKIIFQKTNAESKNYISDFIPDCKNPLNILAMLTHSCAFDNFGTWVFLNHEFEETTKNLREKITQNNPILKQYPWEFSSIPYCFKKVETKEQSLELFQPGRIAFLNHLCLNEDGDNHELPCDKDGKVSIPAVLDIRNFPVAAELSVNDSQGYPVRFGLFKTQQHSAPTVMIIEGGPTTFISFKKFHKAISFFNARGYHVAVPEGLFRSGNPISHYLESQGTLGGRDIEQLKDIMRYLMSQKIASDKINVMGHSYGGFCAARLAHDVDLVKMVLIDAGALDMKYLTSQYPANINRVLKNQTNSSIDLDQHLANISPSIGAPLPRVPTLVTCTRNDVRCPIDQSRNFVNRLLQTLNPQLVYLEAKRGGHGEMFNNYEVLLAFMENKKSTFSSDDVKGYHLVHDTMGFFK